MENLVVKMENLVVKMVGFALMPQEKWHIFSLGLRLKGECGRADARHTYQSSDAHDAGCPIYCG
jgi:hypothetical protein